MNKSILIIATLLFTTLFVNAQVVKQDKKEIKEKVKSLKVGYLTNALELTPEESQKFWPIYNQYEAEKLALSKDKALDQIEITTDSEGATFLARLFELREKEIALDKKYADRLKTAISTVKVAKLYLVEKKFRQEIMAKIVEKKKARG